MRPDGVEMPRGGVPVASAAHAPGEDACTPPSSLTRLDGFDVVALLLLLCLVATLALTLVVPMTYDEAWTWLWVARRGPWYALSSYEVPNNHTLFSIVESLLPVAAVRAFPALIRVPNLVVAAFVTLVLARLSPKPRWLWTSLALASSPLLTIYVFLARGYLMGSLYVLLAGVAIDRGHDGLAGVCAGLAAATVPTFIFVVPGFVLLLVRRRAGKWLGAGVRFGTACVLSALLFYWPKLATVASMGHRYGSHWPLSWVARDTLGVLGANTWLSFALLAVVAWGLSRKQCSNSDVAKLLVAGCVSYVGTVALLVTFHAMRVPYMRNGTFLPLFLLAAVLVLAADSTSGLYRRVALAVLLLSAGMNVVKFVDVFVLKRSEPSAYAPMATLSATPLHRFEGATPARIEVGWAAEPAAQLFFEGNGVRVTINDGIDLRERCLAGSVPGPPGTRVRIVYADGTRGLSCF